VPVTLSAGAAAELGLGVGDDVGFTPASGRTLEATVQRVVPSVPGAGGSPGLALDLADFARASLKASSSLLAPATLWVATDDLHAVAGVTASVSDSPWSIVTRDQAGASAFLSTGTAAWLLVAGVAVLMAFVATAANGAVLRRARRSEETTLRALGFVDRQRRLRRLAESGVAVGAALAAGLVIGVLVAALCTPVMGASAVGGRTVDSPFSDVGVPLLAGLLGALLVVLAAATLLASAEPRSGRPR
jgi:predicted lysophospholipase L1 biosynthesis ABC-type transport system permease subunit